MKLLKFRYFAWGGVLVLTIMGYIIVTKTSLNKLFEERIRSRNNYPPFNNEVKIDSTNLPVIYINTGRIKRNDFINATVRIIDNGVVDYEGEMAIRYRGHATFNSAAKKSYALRPLDENGNKVNVSLLGMKKNKKYALKANWIDQSMIREAIAYELAKSTEVETPQQRFCEVVLNDVYYGVYTLMEQPTRKMVGIKKMKEDISGGYLLYFSRLKESDFIVDYVSNGDSIRYPFIVKYPDAEDLTPAHKAYLRQQIIKMNDAVRDTISTSYNDYIDVLSFIDYQLSSEFACNTDAYWGSGYLYKDIDDIDGRFRVCLWDGDHSFGMGHSYKYSWYNHWIYEFNYESSLDHYYDWWNLLMKNQNYRSSVIKRWMELRQSSYSNEEIAHTIDSLCFLLTEKGAMSRNNQAWNIWDEKKGNNINHHHVKYQSDSFEDEIQYIKNWIKFRLEWMDEKLNFND